MSHEQPQQSIVFDRAVEYYDATRGMPPGVDHDVAAWMVKTANIQPHADILEIGVGTGRIALPLAKHARRYVGVDLSVGMMGKLIQKQPDYAGRVHVVQGDVQQMPIKSASVDHVVSVHVLHLVPSPETAAEEVRRVLKPDGKVLQCRGSWKEEAFEPLWSAWRAGTGTDTNMPTRYDRARAVFADSGWTLEGEYEYEYQGTMTADEVAQRFRGRMMSAMWVMPDEQWQSGASAVEAALKAHYQDPFAPLAVTGVYKMRVFLPPQ